MRTHLTREISAPPRPSVENKVILTVSLGAPRTWVMTKRPPRGAKAAAKKTNTKLPPQESHRWTVGNGSLLLMQGECQQDCKSRFQLCRQ